MTTDKKTKTERFENALALTPEMIADRRRAIGASSEISIET